ncbi:MAG: DUF4260 domain-containing protein [Flavobacteriales bacterium]
MLPNDPPQKEAPGGDGQKAVKEVGNLQAGSAKRCAACLLSSIVQILGAFDDLPDLFQFFGDLLFIYTPFSWCWFIALLLAPDIGMLGYLSGPRTGAWSYNLFHHKGIALAFFAFGWYGSFPVLELVGIILFAHSAMDRMLGYGLKYSDNFEHTHLGWIKGVKKEGDKTTTRV